MGNKDKAVVQKVIKDQRQDRKSDHEVRSGDKFKDTENDRTAVTGKKDVK